MSTKNCRKEPSETGNLGETARADGRYMYTKGTLPRYLFFFFCTGRRHSEEQIHERKSRGPSLSCQKQALREV